MAKFFYQTTHAAMNLAAKLLHLSFEVEGKERVPDNCPKLFVVNHFTRMETFFLPYMIYKTMGLKVKILAAEMFFQGFLGRYLTAVGAVSRGAPNRNRLIIADLMTGKNNWIIYPEGIMVKNKRTIDEHGKVSLKSPYYQGLPHTGAAVLSLKAEVVKQLIWDNMRRKKLSKVREMLKRYDVKVGELSRSSLRIIPVTITYYPMRPTRNKSLAIVRAFAKNKKLPQRIIEELKVEGSLLEGSNVTVHFSKPFNVGESVRKSLYGLPGSYLVDDNTIINYVLQHHRFHITEKVMKQIYYNLSINHDHLLTLFLFHYSKDTFTRRELRYFLFCAIVHLFTKANEFCLKSDFDKDIYQLLAEKEDQSFGIIKSFDAYLKYALKNKYLRIKKRSMGTISYTIQKDRLHRKSSFEKIRIENPLRVVYNEFHSLFSKVQPLVHLAENGYSFSFGLVENIVDVVLRYDREKYRRERERYAKDVFLKDWSVGLPKFFNVDLLVQKKDAAKDVLVKKFDQLMPDTASQLVSFSSSAKPILKVLTGHKEQDFDNLFSDENKLDFGVVVCHGYKSSPREVLSLAHYLHDMHLPVYMPRLDGHGTAPTALKSCSHDFWIADIYRAVYAMLAICHRVILVGFSAGAVLSLYVAADLKLKKKIAGIVSICAPVFLENRLFKLPPYIIKWNALCNFVGLENFHLDFITEPTENPKTNYRINYLKGVSELGGLIEKTKKRLKNISQPILVLQSEKDPVVQPRSADYIYKAVKSRKKEIHFLPRENHVIIRRKGKAEVFVMVEKFLNDFILKNKIQPESKKSQVVVGK